jgi:hypothetical protein
VEYVCFTGKTDAGNNTSLVGYQELARAEINISAFWWTQGEWMPVHELGTCWVSIMSTRAGIATRK